MRRLYALGLWAFLSTCSGDAGTPQAPVYRLQAAGPLLVGDSTHLQFTGARVPSSRSRFEWSSSDPSVISVNDDGRVVAVAPGAARITAEDGLGSGSLEVTVAEAGIGWSTRLPLKARSWVAVADDGWSFVRTSADNSCGLHCEGELFIVDPDGHLARTASGIGEMMVNRNELFFEAGGSIWATTYQSGDYRRVADQRHLLGLFSDGDLLLATGNRVVRAARDGSGLTGWQLPVAAGRAVLLDDDSFVVSAGDAMIRVEGDRQESLALDRALLPWGASEQGALLFSDPYEYGFWSYDADAGSTLLTSRFSVLVDANDRIVESRGLSASLEVPVSLQADGSELFLNLHTEGEMGERHHMEVVMRQGEKTRWRWGHSPCTNHPWAVATAEGFAILTDCNRIVRVSDRTLDPAGSWPQPGGDAARSWRLQP